MTNRSASGTLRERDKQVRRVVQILLLLQQGRWGLGQLSRDFNVSDRTIRRDIEAFQRAGVPVRQFGTDSGLTWTARS